jgi:hypothetical protein
MIKENPELITIFSSMKPFFTNIEYISESELVKERPLLKIFLDSFIKDYND